MATESGEEAARVRRVVVFIAPPHGRTLVLPEVDPDLLPVPDELREAVRLLTCEGGEPTCCPSTRPS